MVETIKAELVKCLREDGYKNVVEAVGADHTIDAIVSKLIKIKWTIGVILVFSLPHSHTCGAEKGQCNFT